MVNFDVIGNRPSLVAAGLVGPKFLYQNLNNRQSKMVNHPFRTTVMKQICYSIASKLIFNYIQVREKFTFIVYRTHKVGFELIFVLLILGFKGMIDKELKSALLTKRSSIHPTSSIYILLFATHSSLPSFLG